MKKSIIYLSITVFISLLFFNCSSDDSNSDTKNEPILGSGHYSLRINGDGLNDELYEMTRDTIDVSGNGVRFSASDINSNFFNFKLPNPIETLQYSVIEYSIGAVNTSNITLSGNGIYLSEDGTIIISNIITDGQCQTFIGTLNINYRRQDNNPGTINVQGTFEVPYYGCD
jgi:hypothetical protein